MIQFLLKPNGCINYVITISSWKRPQKNQFHVSKQEENIVSQQGQPPSSMVYFEPNDVQG